MGVRQSTMQNAIRMLSRYFFIISSYIFIFAVQIVIR